MLANAQRISVICCWVCDAVQLVDCGLGTTTCANAKDKVCLIQRGSITFCQKVRNCADGGGKAAIIFNSNTAADCDLLSATLVTPGCVNPGLLTLGLTKLQGTIIQNALTQGAMVATLAAVVDTILPFEIASGTSMAAPHAAGRLHSLHNMEGGPCAPYLLVLASTIVWL